MQASAEEHRFPCRQCGADMRFAPGEGRLICDHCGNEETVSASGKSYQPIPELDFRRGVEAALPQAETEEARHSKCPNCGAEMEFDPAVHAAECPFCATPVVAGTGTSRHIKPSAVAPFVLTEPDARRAMTGWLGSLWFAPSGLSDYARKGRKLQGVYVPFWTFDAATASRYRGRRGEVYYETERVRVQGRDGPRTETRRVARIRWTSVAGRVSRFFDDVLVLASRSLPAAHTDALMPWDLARLEPYRPEFLAGFRSEGYTIGLEEGMIAARGKMDRMIERDVRFDIGGDRQEISSIDTSVSDVTFKHILLPVWTAAYRYRSKSYRFVVNGQTGSVKGERPWSPVKIVLAIVTAAILIGAGIFLSQYMQAGEP